MEENSNSDCLPKNLLENLIDKENKLKITKIEIPGNDDKLFIMHPLEQTAGTGYKKKNIYIFKKEKQ